MVLILRCLVGRAPRLYFQILNLNKMTYHLLAGMNEFLPNMGVIDDHLCESLWRHRLWCDVIHCDVFPRRSHDSQSPQIRRQLCPILWQLWLICHKIIYTIYGVIRSPLMFHYCTSVGNNNRSGLSITKNTRINGIPGTPIYGVMLTLFAEWQVLCWAGFLLLLLTFCKCPPHAIYKTRVLLKLNCRF